MRIGQLDSDDHELIAKGEDVLEHHFAPGRHRTSAALRASSGEIYTGMNLITGGVTDIHAEPIAYAAALMAEDTDIETSVAVTYVDRDPTKPMTVISACGVCREFFHAFTPDIDIIIPGDPEPMKARLDELLPAKNSPKV